MSDLISFILALEFQWPLAFLLLPLPLIVRYKSSQKQTGYLAPQLPIFETVRELGIGHFSAPDDKQIWKTVILILAWISLVLACAKPTYIGDQVDIALSGRDLMLAIDISPSMQETDMQIRGRQASRLDVVKAVVSEFVEQRAGDRVGLVLFGSQPYLQSPLSFDTVTANRLLQEAYLGMAGQATAIGDAIALGVKRLRQRPEQSRVLVLLSDGANTAGEIPPEKAAQLAAQEKIKIYTIGIGADEMYRRSFFGTKKVNPSADLDEGMLTQIADLSGGQYFRARNTEQLKNIYQAINELEPVEQETKSYRPSKALFYWFLGLTLFLYSAQMIIATLLKRFGSTSTDSIFSERSQGTRSGAVK